MCFKSGHGKVAKYLVYFGKTLCHQDVSKITQSGHTIRQEEKYRDNMYAAYVSSRAGTNLKPTVPSGVVAFSDQITRPSVAFNEYSVPLASLVADVVDTSTTPSFKSPIVTNQAMKRKTRDGP